MRNFIAVLKIILFAVVTLFLHSWILLGFLIAPFGFNRIKWSADVRRFWAKIVANILGMQIITNGKPPKTPFFLVANHLSYTDVWLFYATLNCTFIAKSEVRNWPVIGFVLATSGVIFIDRNKRSDVARVNEEISKNMNADQGIVLFPEGTTSIGDRILPFRSSLFQYPASNNISVHCASITYSTSKNSIPAYQSICWWDDTPFFTHFFRLFKMKEFSATVTFSEETIINSNRKLLASSAQEIIETSFEPVIDKKTHAKQSISS